MERLITEPWIQDATYKGGTLKYTELDGKRIAYHTGTEFLVQVGKGKGSYRPRYRVLGNLAEAVRYYIGINIRRPFKKRLLMPSSTRNPVLARYIGR